MESFDKLRYAAGYARYAAGQPSHLRYAGPLGAPESPDDIFALKPPDWI